MDKKLGLGCQGCLNRREFVKAGIGSLSAAALAGMPLLNACGSSSKEESSSDGVTPTTANNDVFTFSFTDFPALKEEGGSIKATLNISTGKKTVFITRSEAETAHTVSVICTHSGCTLDGYDAKSETYTCPCHGSVFAPDGSVANGPALANLTAYTTVITETGVEVNAS